MDLPHQILRQLAAATAQDPAAFRIAACDLMIHGHTHRPARHEHTVDGMARERFVLADWHDRGQYLASDANGIHLREVRGQTRS